MEQKDVNGYLQTSDRDNINSISIAKAKMTEEEARTCVNHINKNVHNTRSLLLDLEEREGWRALGYKSWRACVTAEFEGKQRYLYYELQAAKIERNIFPTGETPHGANPRAPASPPRRPAAREAAGGMERGRRYRPRRKGDCRAGSGSSGEDCRAEASGSNRNLASIGTRISSSQRKS